MSHNLFEMKRQFLEYIEIEKGRSLKTVENYDHYLTRFLDFAKIKEPKEITDNVIREFRLWLNRQSAGSNKPAGDTLKRKLKIIILFLFEHFSSILLDEK